jgi:hypothetical protein
MENRRLRRALLVATVAALSATALLAIVALLAGDFGDFELRILGTTGGFALSSLIATRGTALLERGRLLPLGRAVIGLSAFAFLAELWVLWIDDDSAAGWKTYVCAIALAGALGQIAGMIARRRPTDTPSVATIVWAAGTCAVILAAMACIAALAEIDDGGYYQAFGAVAILDILGVVLQPVVRRLGSPAQEAAGTGGLRQGRFALVLEDGRRIEEDAGPDLPEAIAAALREAGAHNERVTRIELGDV